MQITWEIDVQSDTNFYLRSGAVIQTKYWNRWTEQEEDNCTSTENVHGTTDW